MSEEENYLEYIFDNNQTFNLYRFAAKIAEKANDYKNASIFYKKCGELYLSYKMEKLFSKEIEKDKKNKELSDKLRERILNVTTD
ncbi:hypothetical protein GW932_03500 [archaeon]|nr:hypothetical protein [archaeon]